MNVDKLHGYTTATKTEGYEQISLRIAARLHGDPYMRIAPFKSGNLGVFEGMGISNDFRGNGTINATTRQCVDRVMFEIASRQETNLVSKIGNEQFAAVVSWAAKKIMQDGRPGGKLGNDSISMNVLQDAYTAASKSLLSYLADEYEASEDGETPDEILFMDMDKDKDDDKDEDKDPADVDEEKPMNRIFLMDTEDFGKYLNRDAATFSVLSKLVDEIPSLAINVEHGLVKDVAGHISKVEELKPERLMKMTADGYAAMATSMPLFAIRLANRELHMYERYTATDCRRVEVVVVDASVSMLHDNRAKRAMAYIVNRLDKVISGDAIVSIALFGTSYVPQEIDGSIIIDTPAKARRAKSIIFGNYTNFSGGGGTNIPLAVKRGYETAKQIVAAIPDQVQGLPHLTILTDDDSSSRSVGQIEKDAVINCLAVSDNEYMRQLCINTGGVYMDLAAIRINAAA